MAALGLLLLVASLVVGAVTGLANSGSDHLATDFSILGYSVDASTGRLFLYGAAVGAVAMLGLNMLLAGLGRGFKNRIKTRRQLKKERSRAGQLEEERERLAHELEEERGHHDTAGTSTGNDGTATSTGGGFLHGRQ